LEFYVIRIVDWAMRRQGEGEMQAVKSGNLILECFTETAGCICKGNSKSELPFLR